MSIAEHSTEWYAEDDNGGVTHVHLTSDDTEIGSYETATQAGSWRVVVRSLVRPYALVTKVPGRLDALVTILSRWDLN